MGPVLGISGHGTLTITVSGLASGQAAAIGESLLSSNNRAGLGPALTFSPSLARQSELILCGTPGRLKQIAA